MQLGPREEMGSCCAACPPPHTPHTRTKKNAPQHRCVCPTFVFVCTCVGGRRAAGSTRVHAGDVLRSPPYTQVQRYRASATAGQLHRGCRSHTLTHTHARQATADPSHLGAGLRAAAGATDDMRDPVIGYLPHADESVCGRLRTGSGLLCLFQPHTHPTSKTRGWCTLPDPPPPDHQPRCRVHMMRPACNVAQLLTSPTQACPRYPLSPLLAAFSFAEVWFACDPTSNPSTTPPPSTHHHHHRHRLHRLHRDRIMSSRWGDEPGECRHERPGGHAPRLTPTSISLSLASCIWARGQCRALGLLWWRTPRRRARWP